MSLVHLRSGTSARLRGAGEQRLRRAGWGLLDQVFVSFTGGAVGIQGARALATVDFGRLSTALAGYYLVFVAVRAAVNEVYLVRFAGRPNEIPEGAPRRAQRATLQLSAAVSLILLTAAVLAPVSAADREITAALAVAMPALLWQDTRRSLLLAEARPVRSALSSGLVLVGQLVGGLGLHVVHRVSAPALLLTWAAAALLAVALVPLGGRGGRSVGPSWLAETRDYWPKFLLQAAAQGGSTQLSLLLVAFISGGVVAGGMRAALLLLSPLLVIQQAGGHFAQAEAGRVSVEGRARFMVTAQIVLVLLSLSWILLVSRVVPTSWLAAAVGPNLAAGKAALPGMGTFLAASMAIVVPVAVLRNCGRLNRGLVLGVVLLPACVIPPSAVAAAGGSIGAVAVAFGAFGILSALVWTVECLRTLRRMRVAMPAEVR